MLITENTANPKNGGKRTAAILVAIGVHIGIGIVAALIAVLPPLRDEPEIVAQVVTPLPQQELKIQKKEVLQQAQHASSAAASSSVARLIKANAVATIGVPDVKDFLKGPVGLGTGDLGDGFGMGDGLGGGGRGRGLTMFGATGSEGLVGVFYDLKQTPDRKPTGFNSDSEDDYYGALRRFYDKHFSPKEVAGYYQARQKMSFTYLAVPDLKADEGPKAFNVEKEVQPRAWFVHYHGRLGSPRGGEWRFVGMFDDALYVFINGKLVLNASYHIHFSDPEVSRSFGKRPLGNKRPGLAGSWVVLGSSFEIDILVGERPGGEIGGALLIEKKGEKYERRKEDDTPILPVFSTVEITARDWKQICQHPYGFARETPVFSPLN